MRNETAIIMSVYKNDKLEYLKQALESLYTQTLKSDIFLMLDGKVSPEIEAYLDNELSHNRIVFLDKRDQNRGLAYSLNALLNTVLPLGYRYIARMDADDISLPLRIEKQTAFLDTHQEISAVGGWIEEFNVDSGERQLVRYAQTSEQIVRSMIKRNPMAHVTLCFRNSFFDTIPSYNTEALNEDFDLWIRALKHGIKLYNLQEVLVYVRTNDAFFARRKNIHRAIEVMRLKWDATRTFGFGIKGYGYAVAHFFLFMAPSWLKRYIYTNLRG